MYEDSKKIVTLCLADEGESEDSFVKQYRAVIKEVQDRLEYLPLVDIVKGTTMTNSSVNLTTGVYNPPSSAVETYYSQSCAADIMNGHAKYYFFQGRMGRKLLKRLDAIWMSVFASAVDILKTSRSAFEKYGKDHFSKAGKMFSS